LSGTAGAGKHSIIDRWMSTYQKEGMTVGVIAVDPTSPFSGGAIMGDRIRMQRHFLDDGVFIRSVATRGFLGGLSRSAGESVRVLDAAGFDVVILETVGGGQDEFDIAKLAQTTIVIVPPGMGDDIQAIKAGILEVAQILVVNKADRDGADVTVRDLESMVMLGHHLTLAPSPTSGHSAAAVRVPKPDGDTEPGSWLPPVIKTVATSGEGV